MNKLAKLRDLMKHHKIDAYIIPSEDQHQSEYVTDRDKRREFISGFSGSAGTALVTNENALLWTDGRYFLQAEKQLDPSSWKLMKGGIDIPLNEYLKQHLKEKQVGLDGNLFSLGSYKQLKETNVALKLVEPNLVDQVWENQPSYPNNPIFKLDVKFAGRSHQEKLEMLRSKMTSAECEFMVLSCLDEIAWTLNLRGSDIPFNPLFLSYLVISHKECHLFVDKQVDVDGLLLHPYGEISKFLKNLTGKVWIDSDTANVSVFNSIANPVTKQSPVVFEKAIKNDTELDGIRTCHIRDGAAVCKFFSWIEEELTKGTCITECSASDQLEMFRSKNENFVSLSFDTIAGMGPNGAIIHYKPQEETCAQITKDSIFLLDSGAQYFDGTTDITRTVHFGNPTDYQKKCFTLVLKGHIALDLAVFPEGTNGSKLDTFPRQFLWKEGLDYRHGTGHGVGHFLCVHEGPQSIGARASAQTPLQVGMILSNEPGYYENGNFGIRIENLVIVVDKSVKGGNYGNFFGFEHVTCVPMQTKLLDLSIMTEEEIKWVNDYNSWCLEKLTPLLKDDKKTLEWLEAYTKKVSK